MTAETFTHKKVSAFACERGKQQSFMWDISSPGLGLRATANGSKSFIFQGELHGKTIRLTIGDPRTLKIGDAQEKAAGYRRMLREGIDPREEKKHREAAHVAKQTAKAREALTFGEAWDSYVQAKAAKWSERNYLDHVRYADVGGTPRKRGGGVMDPGPLASLRPLKLTELTGERIAQWLDCHKTERPTMAALCFRMLRAFLRWTARRAEYRGLVPAESYLDDAVKDALPKAKVKTDALQREQLAPWFKAVRSMPNRVISAYLQGVLITGARREELAGLKWDDVDFKWGSMKIGDKVEEERTIPLTPYLAMLLKGLPHVNDYVFSSPKAEEGKIAEPRIAHLRALKHAGLPHITMHGLRRSFNSLAEWVDLPVGVRAQIMGHKPSAIAEKHYTQRPIDLLRFWHTRIEKWMLEQAGVHFEYPPEKAVLQVIKAERAQIANAA